MFHRLLLLVMCVFLSVSVVAAQTTVSTDVVKVLAVTPTENANNIIPGDIQISVMFDRSVVPVSALTNRSTEELIRTEPMIEGSGAWVHPAIYVFTPSENALIGGTQYTVTVEDGVQAADGSRLLEPFQWSFRTIEPQTIEIRATKTWHQRVLLDSAFTVSFSQPMDRETTAAAFTLQRFVGPPCYDGCAQGLQHWVDVEGSVIWDKSDTFMTFVPTEPLTYQEMYDGGYTATVTTSALNALGTTALATPASARFFTVSRPAVTEVSPIHGERVEPGYRLVTIRFSGKMNPESYRGRYRVTPAPPGDVTPYVREDGTLLLAFFHRLDETYTITLLPGIEDIYGTRIEQPISVTYNVRPRPPQSSFSLQMPNGNYFAIAGTYQEDPAVTLNVRGETTISLDIYQSNLNMLRRVIDQPLGYYGGVDFSQLYSPQSRWNPDGSQTFAYPYIPWSREEYLISRTTRQFNVTERQGENVQIPLRGANDDPLPMGIYGVEVNGSAGFVLAVANAAITVKHSSHTGESLIWVTDLTTAQPIPHAIVKIHGATTTITGRADAEGIFRVDTSRLRELAFITVEAENVFGIWYAGFGSWGQSNSSTYLYTDRPLYRPGEPVHFRGILRSRDDISNMTYSIPDEVDTIYASIVRWECYGCELEVLYTNVLPITDFGTFSDSLTLPHDLAPGSYTIEVTTCSPDEDECWSAYRNTVNFTVAEFRVPEFTIQLTPQRDEVIAGDPVNVDLLASYYFGSAVSDATVTRRGWGHTTGFNYQGTETGFVFTNPYEGGVAEIYQPPSLMTNANGRVLMTDVPDTSRMNGTPVLFNLEATVTDASGQAISGRTRFLIHPASLYIGLRPSSDVVAPNTPSDIDILTVTPESTLRPNQVVRVEIIQRQWVRREVSFGVYNWEFEETLLDTLDLVTDSAGHSSYKFIASNEGTFRIVAYAEDELGRMTTSAVTLTVRDSELSPDELGDPFTYTSCLHGEEIVRLNVTTDRNLYFPGDTATLTFQNPYGVPLTGLITIERANIRQQEVITVDGELYTYRLPITGEDAPNIYVSVVLHRPLTQQEPMPIYLRGSANLQVDNIERRLHIDVTSSHTTAEPGDTITFDFVVTDNNGQPAQAEVGVSLIDEAVLALWYWREVSQERHFYPQQPLNVHTQSSVPAILSGQEQRIGSLCGMGGGGGDPAPTLRDDYIYTPLWAPHVVTNEQGRASVSVVMPSNLTSWQLDARAITGTTQVGEAETHIVTTKPLIVRPVTPRFFIEGDYLPIAAIIHNNTDEAQTVTVTLEQRGIRLNDPSLIRTISIEPHSLQRLEWWGIVEATDGVYVAFYAQSETGLEDAAIPALTTGTNNTIPVHRYVVTETLASSGSLTSAGSRTEQIALPEVTMEDMGNLTIRLDSSLNSTLQTSISDRTPDLDMSTDALAYSILSHTAEWQALTAANNLDAEAQQAFNALFVDATLRFKHDQNQDGGWGWYDGMSSDPSITAYVLLSLREMERLGTTVDTGMIERATHYLSVMIPIPQTNTPANELNQQALFLYALAVHREVDLEYLDSFYSYRLEMSFTARAYLLLAYSAVAPESEAVLSLVSDLSSGAIISGTGAHWEEENRIDRFGGDTQTTAVTLLALLTAQPNHPLAENAIRWLMTARAGDVWQTEQETVWAVMAISKWTQHAQDTVADYTFSLELNDQVLFEERFSPQVEAGNVMWTLPLATMTPAALNDVTIHRSQGDGTLYYSMLLELLQPADQVKAVERGIRIEREYLRDVDRQPVETVQVGDIVVIRLTLYVSQEIFYFTLQDTLPSGLEALDYRWLTTTSVADPPDLQSLDRRSHYWYWGAHYFGRSQLHDDGILLQATYLPRGVYSYTYQTRATTPGTFRVLPALAYATNQPEVFGRSDARLFVVEGQN